MCVAAAQFVGLLEQSFKLFRHLRLGLRFFPVCLIRDSKCAYHVSSLFPLELRLVVSGTELLSIPTENFRNWSKQ